MVTAYKGKTMTTPAINQARYGKTSPRENEIGAWSACRPSQSLARRWKGLAASASRVQVPSSLVARRRRRCEKSYGPHGRADVGVGMALSEFELVFLLRSHPPLGAPTLFSPENFILTCLSLTTTIHNMITRFYPTFVGTQTTEFVKNDL
jgi:hypothetical protein